MSTATDASNDRTAPDRTAPDTAVDVAIVGAGPVGLTLAVLLAQLGRTVIVLETLAPAIPAAPGGTFR